MEFTSDKTPASWDDESPEGTGSNRPSARLASPWPCRPSARLALPTPTRLEASWSALAHLQDSYMIDSLSDFRDQYEFYGGCRVLSWRGLRIAIRAVELDGLRITAECRAEWSVNSHRRKRLGITGGDHKLIHLSLTQLYEPAALVAVSIFWRECSVQLVKMLGVFSREVAEPPEELVAAGSRTPSPKTRASELINRFVNRNSSAQVISLQLGSSGHLAYSPAGYSPFRPRYGHFILLSPSLRSKLSDSSLIDPSISSPLVDPRLPEDSALRRTLH
ncbi:hypothetical protein KSP40_PGU012924 [Platanthera guangdongensis]|uniref:DUF3700 domain-containing protein n=1 Tax=Platanthera guangdongensis TaxID=2320717 RepID=A0ABR2MUF2_9ASPA